MASVCVTIELIKIEYDYQYLYTYTHRWVTYTERNIIFILHDNFLYENGTQKFYKRRSSGLSRQKYSSEVEKRMNFHIKYLERYIRQPLSTENLVNKIVRLQYCFNQFAVCLQSFYFFLIRKIL